MEIGIGFPAPRRKDAKFGNYSFFTLCLCVFAGLIPNEFLFALFARPIVLSLSKDAAKSTLLRKHMPTTRWQFHYRILSNRKIRIAG